jgi:hypothetical protein
MTSSNTSSPLTLIVAPHADDELIGCFSVLEAHRTNPEGRNLVVLLDTSNPDDAGVERIQEFKDTVRYFGGTALVGISDHLDLLAKLQPGDLVYLPSRTDGHPAHQRVTTEVLYHTAISRWAQSPGRSEVYYSVDMNVPQAVRTLSPHDQRAKLNALREFYPSQRALFDSDAKYHLFETLLPSDSVVTLERCRGLSSSDPCLQTTWTLVVDAFIRPIDLDSQCRVLEMMDSRIDQTSALVSFGTRDTKFDQRELSRFAVGMMNDMARDLVSSSSRVHVEPPAVVLRSVSVNIDAYTKTALATHTRVAQFTLNF